MSTEQRREMIVRAVLPLVAEHGAGITTSQIARAAGIGEGTIFRAFKDKDELLDACIAEVVRPDSALQAIAEIPLDQPLRERLVEAAATLTAHLERLGSVVGAMLTAGRPPGRPEPSKQNLRARRESFTAMRDGIAELFEPERDGLRLPPEKLAALFSSLLLSLHRDGDQAATVDEIVDVFLNGACR
ncbi:TetR/AcrR family transcriptional regulator [Amycolatopsis sp. YIM 10]|uniref:TetR/AcrR family transcriptional regulator n=1 Tax=Amycolatopsis sp. YIM 10 TaxID=2653857 RepID=UPI00128FD6C9|nr:TetR/AcrR family transcriptional regulator [Amycolatopsis sp. YIM 10]QFU94576.1 transcriptional regulator BetI [Amycolatopsis sp. YIM 10]